MTNEISRKMTKAVTAVLEEKKGKELSIIDISDVSVVADYFIIVTADNARQAEALSDAVEEEMERQQFPLRQKEGVPSSGWVLLDYHDVIVHIFDKDQRLFYDLERLWSDGKKFVKAEDLEEKG